MKKHVPLSLAGIFLACQLAATAAATPQELQAAIDKAKILTPGSGVAISVGRNQAVVATYRNTKADEKDCKIDAVLMARTIMQLAPEITSVTVYFYNRKDLSTYEQVTLSAGDIKAFGSGDLAKEQFLASVKVEHHEADDAARISSYIQASQRRMERRPAEAKFDKGNVDITVDMEAWVPERDVRVEALRVAEKVLVAHPPDHPVQKVRVTFADPDEQMPNRSVVLNADDIMPIDQSLARVLASVRISQAPARAFLDVSEGPQLDERKDLVRRIAGLRAAGADYADLQKDYGALEQALKTENEAKIKARIATIGDAITTRENSLRSSAEEHHSSGPASKVTREELQAALESAHILSPGTTMTVGVKESEAIIATYKPAIANEKDCKIDAVLLAKTAMQVGPDLSGVTVYFYGRSDLSTYEEVRLSAGDIKAFASGQTSKDEFLSSVKVEQKKTEDSARIASAVQSSQSSAMRRPAQATYNNGNVDVVVQMEPWVTERDAQYEALRIVEKVVEANTGKTIGNVHITFMDPDMQSGDREVSFSPALLAQLEPALTAAIAGISLSHADIAGPQIVPGIFQTEREQIARRLEALKNANVGISGFMPIYAAIQQAVIAQDEATCTLLIKKLSDALDQQEKNMKAMKERPVTATSGPSGPAAPVTGPPIEGRWAIGGPVLDSGRVLHDPDGYIAEVQGVIFNSRDPRLMQQNYGRYYHALRFFAQQLRIGKKTDEADKFDRRVYEWQAQHPGIH